MRFARCACKTDGMCSAMRRCVAVPYGELSSAQLRVLARIAREYDVPDPEVYRAASEAQGKLGTERLPTHCAHFTTRTNVQVNWIPLD